MHQRWLAKDPCAKVYRRELIGCPVHPRHHITPQQLKNRRLISCLAKKQISEKDAAESCAQQREPEPSTSQADAKSELVRQTRSSGQVRWRLPSAVLGGTGSRLLSFAGFAGAAAATTGGLLGAHSPLPTLAGLVWLLPCMTTFSVQAYLARTVNIAII